MADENPGCSEGEHEVSEQNSKLNVEIDGDEVEILGLGKETELKLGEYFFSKITPGFQYGAKFEKIKNPDGSLVFKIHFRGIDFGGGETVTREDVENGLELDTKTINNEIDLL